MKQVSKRANVKRERLDTSKGSGNVFVKVCTGVSRCKDLDVTGIGIWVKLMDLPPNWHLSVSGFAEHTGLSWKTVRKYFDQFIRMGLMVETRYGDYDCQYTLIEKAFAGDSEAKTVGKNSTLEVDFSSREILPSSEDKTLWKNSTLEVDFSSREILPRWNAENEETMEKFHTVEPLPMEKFHTGVWKNSTLEVKSSYQNQMQDETPASPSASTAAPAASGSPSEKETRNSNVQSVIVKPGSASTDTGSTTPLALPALPTGFDANGILASILAAASTAKATPQPVAASANDTEAKASHE